MSPFKAEIQRHLKEYEPGESNYQALYDERLKSLTVDELATLAWDELTRLLQISWDYLYDDSIGVVKIKDESRWPIDRKHLVEAEQHAFQRKLRQARRLWVKNLLENQAVLLDDWVDRLPPEYRKTASLHLKKHASEAIVQAPFAYHQEERGLIHDVIVVLYEGKQDGDSIHFPLGKGVDIDKLRNSIAVAKDAAFEYYNQHAWWQIRRRLNPEDYSIRIYIDDYPGGNDFPGGMAYRRFSGQSFTLAVSLGILACLMNRKILSTVAFSAEVGTIDGNLQPIDYEELKAKAACLNGITKLVICANSDRELDACAGVLEAQLIQVRQAKKRPNNSNTDVINVNSLEGALEEIWPTSHWPEGIEQVGQVLGQLKPVLTALAIFVVALIGCGILWFHFDQPVLTAGELQVRPTTVMVTPEEVGQTKELKVSASFQSRLFTSQWLKIASLLYGHSYYWIRCPNNVTQPVLQIDSANFQKQVQFTVPPSDISMGFELKTRQGTISTANVTFIKVRTRFPGGKQ